MAIATYIKLQVAIIVYDIKTAAIGKCTIAYA